MAVSFQAYRLLSHWLSSESNHSVHSPGLFSFYSNLLVYDQIHPWMVTIEKSRELLKTNKHHIDLIEFGSGPTLNLPRRSIRQIALSSLTPPRWSRLLSRLIFNIQAVNILELGTCLGINTLYLSENPLVKVWTMEGNPVTAESAKVLFQEYGRKNIELIIGNIDNQLHSTLQKITSLDLGFLDANHRYKPTMIYAKAIWSKIRPGGVLIIDDINRSSEMRKAWMALTNMEGCCASVDLYRWGLILKGPSELEGHHTWIYGSLFKP